MDVQDHHYLTAVDTALRTAGVTERSAGSVASKIFQAPPALDALDAYLERLKKELPWYFAPPARPPVPEVTEVRASVQQAHFLVNVAAIAGAPPVAAAPVAAPTAPPPKTIPRGDNALFLRHVDAIAKGEIDVV